jgi:hypothetical protein
MHTPHDPHSSPGAEHDADLAEHDTDHPAEILPEEPKTPAWLPLLGISLFLGALLILAIGSRSEQPQDAASTAPPTAPNPAK